MKTETEHFVDRHAAIEHYQWIIPAPMAFVVADVDRKIANGSITVGTKKS